MLFKHTLTDEELKKRVTPLALQLRKLRRDKNFSLKKMAEFIGVPLRTYKNWEYGYCTPDMSALQLIKMKIMFEVYQINEPDLPKDE